MRCGTCDYERTCTGTNFCFTINVQQTTQSTKKAKDKISVNKKNNSIPSKWLRLCSKNKPKIGPQGWFSRTIIHFSLDKKLCNVRAKCLTFDKKSLRLRSEIS